MAAHGDRESARFLLWEAHRWRCALPVEHVVETLRPLEIRALAGTPAFVSGVAVIRGAAVPVLDAAALLGAEGEGSPTRWIVVRSAPGRAALAVSRVLGVRALPAQDLHALPSVLGAGEQVPLAALGTLDAELFGVLRSARIVPESVWTALSGAPAS